MFYFFSKCFKANIIQQFNHPIPVLGIVLRLLINEILSECFLQALTGVTTVFLLQNICYIGIVAEQAGYILPLVTRFADNPDFLLLSFICILEYQQRTQSCQRENLMQGLLRYMIV